MADDFETGWRSVTASTDAGVFKLDPNAYLQLAKILNDHDAALFQADQDINQIRHVSGLGAFPQSGQAVEGKYTNKASGAPDSLENRINEHRVQVQAMLRTLGKMVDNFTGVDDYVAKNLAHAAGGK